jgi:hypothetical protein
MVIRCLKLVLLMSVSLLMTVGDSEACLQCRCRQRNPDGSPQGWSNWMPAISADNCTALCVQIGISCDFFPPFCHPTYQPGDAQTGASLPANACPTQRPPPRNPCNGPTGRNLC